MKYENYFKPLIFCNCSPYESRFPINIGVTGQVATTGEVCRS